MSRLQEPPPDLHNYHPSGPFRFHPVDLKSHVKRHVLCPDERWKDLISPATLKKARAEVSTVPFWGEACEEIAQSYEKLAAEQISASLLKVETHDHHVRIHENNRKSLGICSWPDAKIVMYTVVDIRLTDISGKKRDNFVSPESSPPYLIRTAYRPPDLVNSDRQEFRMHFWREAKIDFHQKNRYFDCPGLRENTHD